MEGKKNIFLVLLCFILLSSFGQSNKTIYKAYINGNMTKWKYVTDSIESVQGKTNKDKLELLSYHYGYIAWCIDNKKISVAEKMLERSEELIKELEGKKYNLSMLYAYKAAFIGFKIGISPYKAPFIGSESLDFAKRSIAIDSTNSFGYIQLGNIAYYTPNMLGGSKKTAMQYYVKAMKLMEKHPRTIQHNWNYLNLLAIIIYANLETEQYKMAKHYCIKTLSIEPDFDWVKNKLYPQVLKQLKP